MANLTFIVGAGASAEFGFPTGHTLKGEIAKLARSPSDRQGEHRRRYFSEPRIENAILQEKSSNAEAFGGYVAAFRLISRSITLAPSIDNFLEAHKDNEYVVSSGKLLIAYLISKHEESSGLKVDTSNIYNDLDFSKISDNWMNRLFQILVEGRSEKQFENMASSVRFIIFNYDRCLEQFFMNAISTYYGTSRDRANEIFSHFTVIHPYGSLGQIGFSDASFGNFGETLDRKGIFSASREIRTFTEHENSREQASLLEGALENSSAVVFLVFGFHPMNLDLLFDVRKLKTNKILATASGISESNKEAIFNKIKKYLETRAGNKIVLENTRCTKLIEDNWRYLSNTLAS